MPWDFTQVVPGLRILSAQVRQLYDGLTGAISDQPITPAGIFRLINNLGLDTSILSSDPAAPGAGITRLYPKAGGWYFREGAAGAVTPLNTPALASLTPSFIDATGEAANTVLLLTGTNTWTFGQITSGYFAPGATMVKLGQAELSGNASSVSFTSIPQTYKNLILIVEARTSVAALNDPVIIRFNGDSGANYDWVLMRVLDTTVSGANGIGTTEGIIATVPAASGTAGYFGQCAVTIPAYTRTTAQKAAISHGGGRDTAAAANIYLRHYHSWWRNTSAITQVGILPGTGPNFVAGTSMYLYGTPA